MLEHISSREAFMFCCLVIWGLINRFKMLVEFIFSLYTTSIILVRFIDIRPSSDLI